MPLAYQQKGIPKVITILTLTLTLTLEWIWKSLACGRGSFSGSQQGFRDLALYGNNPDNSKEKNKSPKDKARGGEQEGGTARNSWPRSFILLAPLLRALGYGVKENSSVYATLTGKLIQGIRKRCKGAARIPAAALGIVTREADINLSREEVVWASEALAPQGYLDPNEV